MAQLEEKAPAAVQTVRNYVGGRWEEPSGRELLAVGNPASGERIASLPMGAAEEVDRAVRAAADAFPRWRATPPLERARACFALKALLEQRFEELAQIVTRDNGKAISDARGEVRRGIECVEVATGIPTLMQGHVLEDVARGIDEEMVRQPLGVCAAITPFNFPFMVPMWFLPFAVACGNTFVCKPSEQDPLAMQLTFELIDQAGFPPGVVNLVNGGREAATALLEHPGVRAISFVGSTPVAHHVYETAARHGKRVQALGGAKNHVVVMPDADLDGAVRGVLSSAFHAAGQRCLANSVCVAVGDVYEPLRRALVDAAGRMVVGDGADEATEVGPVISAAARERIAGFVERAERDGAELLLDGREPGAAGGCFVGPTIVEAEPGSELAQEEVFGPVLTLLRARDLGHALEIMNASPKGNAASIFTRSGGAMRRFRHDAQAGMLGVNVGVAAPMAFFPFGGAKQSLFGDLHATGRDAIEFFTQKKVVISRWPDEG